MNSAVDNARIATFEKAISDYSTSLMLQLKEKTVTSEEFLPKYEMVMILSKNTEKYAGIFKNLPLDMINENFVSEVLGPLSQASVNHENSGIEIAVNKTVELLQNPPKVTESKIISSDSLKPILQNFIEDTPETRLRLLENMIERYFYKADHGSDYEDFKPTMRAMFQALLNTNIDANIDFCYNLFPEYIRNEPEFHHELTHRLYSLSILKGFHQAGIFKIADLKERFKRRFDDLERFIYKSFRIMGHEEKEYNDLYNKFKINELTFEQVYSFIIFNSSFLEQGELDKVPYIEHLPWNIRSLPDFNSQLCIKLMALIR